MDTKAVKLQLERLREAAARRKVDFAEIRCAAVAHSALMLQDGRADRVGAGRRTGMGVRVLSNGAWGFASTESLDESDWLASHEDAHDKARVTPVRMDEPVVRTETPGGVD